MYTAEQFLAFARTKPADEAYNYMSNGNCAFAQFLRAQGYENPRVFGFDYSLSGLFGNTQPLPAALIENDSRALQADTWGECVARLEAVLAAKEAV
jgi:hypothetical protein